jgi:pyruvate/2-oxoglutarate dehydrogenase complex dihydrolipoamide dehydrogenase (E3) component
MRYDLAIIGGGSAAFAAAIHARRKELRIIMVERDEIGGTCVNVGQCDSCSIPRRTLVSLRYYRRRRQHRGYAFHRRTEIAETADAARIADLARAAAGLNMVSDALHRFRSAGCDDFGSNVASFSPKQ